MAQVCGHWEERGSVTSLVAATVHSDGGSPASRRPLVRLLGLVPAALLLSGLFSVWAGPLAAPVAAAAPAGGEFSLALKSDGTVVTWGRNASNPPAGLTGVTAIAAGESHSLALYTAADVLVTSGMTTPRMADSTGSIRVTALDGPASASIAIAAPSISRTRMQPPACLRTTPSPQPTTVPTSSSRT